MNWGGSALELEEGAEHCSELEQQSVQQLPDPAIPDPQRDFVRPGLSYRGNRLVLRSRSVTPSRACLHRPREFHERRGWSKEQHSGYVV